MNLVERAISSGARFWLQLRERARCEGGGLFYWLFALMGMAGLTGQMSVTVQQHHLLSFPLDLFIPLLLALLWVRSAWYRLHPVKMFIATLVLSSGAGAYLGTLYV